jgi:hypothetical protein
MAALRRRKAFRLAEADLHSGIPISVWRLDLRDESRPCLDNSRCFKPTVITVELRHADFSA